jgi:hypothetical protein
MDAERNILVLDADSVRKFVSDTDDVRHSVALEEMDAVRVTVFPVRDTVKFCVKVTPAERVTVPVRFVSVIPIVMVVVLLTRGDFVLENLVTVCERVMRAVFVSAWLSLTESVANCVFVSDNVCPIVTDEEPVNAYVIVTVPVTVSENVTCAVSVLETVSVLVIVAESESDNVSVTVTVAVVRFLENDSVAESVESDVSVTVAVIDAPKVSVKVVVNDMVTSSVELLDMESSCVVELVKVGRLDRL